MRNKKGKQSASPFYIIYERLRLVHSDFDPPRLGLFGFRNMYLQDLVRGLDTVVLHGFRKRKRSPEFSTNPLHATILGAISCLFGLALAGESKRSIFNFQMEIFLLHPRKLGANQVRVLAFQNVYRWIPGNRIRLFPSTAEALPEQVVNPRVHSIQTLKRFPSY